jgi:FHS family L-fucose permease-like MFS transporter
MAIPMMGYILALVFPIYVNIYKKDSMDLHRNTEINVTVQVDRGYALEEGVPSKPTVAKVRPLKKGPAPSDVAGPKGNLRKVGYGNYISYDW